MGWCSGGELLNEVWSIIREHLPKEKKCELSLKLIDAFEDMDCDVIEETDIYFEMRTNEDFVVKRYKSLRENSTYYDDREELKEEIEFFFEDDEKIERILDRIFENK